MFIIKKCSYYLKKNRTEKQENLETCVYEVVSDIFIQIDGSQNKQNK